MSTTSKLLMFHYWLSALLDFWGSRPWCSEGEIFHNINNFWASTTLSKRLLTPEDGTMESCIPALRPASTHPDARGPGGSVACGYSHVCLIDDIGSACACYGANVLRLIVFLFMNVVIIMRKRFDFTTTARTKGDRGLRSSTRTRLGI